jgi:hypothetical protein
LRYHYKIIEEKTVIYDGCHLGFYLIRTETFDTFEQKLFSSIILKDRTGVAKCYIKELSSPQEYVDTVHPILAAIENKTFESKLLHGFSPDVYDVSSLLEEHRQLVHLILKSQQNDRISKLYHQWFSFLRASSAGAITPPPEHGASGAIQGLPRDSAGRSGGGVISRDLFSMLIEFTQHHVEISKIPFSDEIMRQFMVHFEFLLEKQSEDLSCVIDWIEFITSSSFSVYTWEIMQIVHNWLCETKYCEIKNEVFIKSIKQILHLVELNYDNKKILSKK